MSKRKRIERAEVHKRRGNVYRALAPTPMRLKKRGKGVVAVPEAELPALTAEQIRDTLERVRHFQPELSQKLLATRSRR